LSEWRAIAAIVGTRNLKDEKMRNGIIGKTIKQYNNVKKPWDANTYELACGYAHGGIPANLSPVTLIETFENIQKISLRKAASMSRPTTMKSTVFSLAGVSDLQKPSDDMEESIQSSTTEEGEQGEPSQ